jgi:GDSL-like Lipase/Acylhydrolase family
MKTFFTNLALTLGVLLAGLLLCEVALRAFVPVRNVGPSFSVYDPIYGQRLRASFSTERKAPEFAFRFTTNSLGFRGAEPKAFPHRPILFLGDSFTEGYGLDDGGEYPALVEDALAQCYGAGAVPVVNAGIGRSGTGRWLKFLRAEGPRFAPRLIVLQLFANDFGDNLSERLFQLAADEEELVEVGPEPKGKMRLVQDIVDAIPILAHSYLIGFARQVHWWFTVAPQEARLYDAGGAIQPGDRLTFRLVDEVLALAQRQGWPVLGLIVAIDGLRGERLTEIFRRHGAASLRVAGRDQRRDLYYRVDIHWNAAGHRHAARQVIDWLLQNEGVWRAPPVACASTAAITMRSAPESRTR